MFRPAFVSDPTAPPNQVYLRSALNISAQYAFLAKTNRDEFYKAMLRWDSDYGLRREIIKSAFLNINPEERKSFFDDFVWNDAYKTMYGHHILIQDFVGVLTELLPAEAAASSFAIYHNHPILVSVVNKAVKHVFGVMKDDGYFRDIIMSETGEEIINEEYKKDLVAAIFNIFPEDKLIAIINYVGVSEKLERSSTRYTALHFAILRELMPLAELLIAKGANVNAEDEYGFTPLHVTKSKAVAEFLVAKGAVSAISKYHKKTPLDLARVKGNAELASYLESLPQPLPEVAEVEVVATAADLDSATVVSEPSPVLPPVVPQNLLGDIMEEQEAPALLGSPAPKDEEWHIVPGVIKELPEQEMAELLRKARFLSDDLSSRAVAEEMSPAKKSGAKKKKKRRAKVGGGGSAVAESEGEVPAVDNEKQFYDLLKPADSDKLKNLLGSLSLEEATELVTKNQEAISTLLDNNSKNSADIIKCFLIYGAELPGGSARKIMAVKRGKENFLQSVQKFDGKERLLFAALNGLDNIFTPGFVETQNPDDVFAVIEEIIFKYPETNQVMVKNLMEVFYLDKRKAKIFLEEPIIAKLRRNPSLSETWKSYSNPESNYELSVMAYIAKEGKSDLLGVVIDAVGIDHFRARFESFAFRGGVGDVATMATSFGKVGILQMLCAKGVGINNIHEKISTAQQFIEAASADGRPQFTSQIRNFQETLRFLNKQDPGVDVGGASGVMLRGVKAVGRGDRP